MNRYDFSDDDEMVTLIAHTLDDALRYWRREVAEDSNAEPVAIVVHSDSEIWIVPAATKETT